MIRARTIALVLVGGWALGGTISFTVASAAAPADAVSKIETLGGVVRQMANDSNAIEVDFQFSGAALKDEHLQVLQSIKPIALLRLKNTGITDAALISVGKLTGLKRLDLSGTAITDAGLKHLADLQELESLNLFSTAVTDTGLDAVRGWPALKQLLVWRTKVSADGIARLQMARPALEVIPDPAADHEHARIIAETASATLIHAQETLPLIRKESEEVIAQAERNKKEFEEAEKRAAQNVANAELRKQANTKRQAAKEAAQKAVKAKDAIRNAELAVTTARQQAEEAQRDLARLSASSNTNQLTKP